MDEFERLLEAERVSVERFVRFRMSSKADADDVLQEIFLTAYQKFPQLKNTTSKKQRHLAETSSQSWRKPATSTV